MAALYIDIRRKSASVHAAILGWHTTRGTHFAGARRTGSGRFDPILSFRRASAGIGFGDGVDARKTQPPVHRATGCATDRQRDEGASAIRRALLDVEPALLAGSCAKSHRQRPLFARG